MYSNIKAVIFKLSICVYKRFIHFSTMISGKSETENFPRLFYRLSEPVFGMSSTTTKTFDSKLSKTPFTQLQLILTPGLLRMLIIWGSEELLGLQGLIICTDIKIKERLIMRVFTDQRRCRENPNRAHFIIN